MGQTECAAMKVVAALVSATLLQAQMALTHEAGMLNQTNFAPTSQKCEDSTNSKVYLVPLGACYNPGQRFNGDSQWGSSDILDVLTDGVLSRSFFSSTDGSCTTRNGSF